MEKTAEKYRAQFGAPRGAGAYITRLVYALVTVALGNSYILVKTGAAPAWAIAIIAAVFLFMCVKPYFGAKKLLKKRLRTVPQRHRAYYHISHVMHRIGGIPCADRIRSDAVRAGRHDA